VGVSRHHPTMGLGECRNLPQRGPKMDLCIFEVKNTLYSIFERLRAPQTSRGPGKLSPPPLDGPGPVTTLDA